MEARLLPVGRCHCGALAQPAAGKGKMYFLQATEDISEPSIAVELGGILS